MAADETRDLTIEALAAESGMSVSNIRAHQAKGLLHPPDVRGRTGFYGPDHVTRLNLIRDLQSEGFNLKGIKHLLDQTRGAADSLIGLRRAVTAPFETESPEVFELAELAERFGLDPAAADTAEMLAMAEDLGIVVPLGDGRYEAPSPGVLEAADQALASGIGLRPALDVIARTRRSAKDVAAGFSELFLEEVWRPFEAAGYPEERWPEVMASIESLRPLASTALLSVFQLTMTREVEERFGDELRRFGGGEDPGGED